MAPKSPVQKLVVGSATYLWSVSHEHSHSHHGHAHACREVFTAFLNGKSQSPLQVYFTEEEALRMAEGSVTVGAAKTIVKLGEEATARALIDAARVAGWEPEQAKQPFAIADGLALLSDVSL